MTTHFSLVPPSLLMIAIIFGVQDVPPKRYREVRFEELTITMTIEERAPSNEKLNWPD